MNAVEIEAAVSDLVAQPFNKIEFPFEFLAAFGSKETTLKQIRKGLKASSDIAGAIVNRNNIHLAVCESGLANETLKSLKESPKTAAAKVKFVFATDGDWFEAEDLISGEPLSAPLADLPNHFGFFLALAGISTVKEIKDNPIDIRATGRLNKLYVELLKENPDWATAAKRPDMNHLMARLIFCFFAEDTHIFLGDGLFTKTIQQMTESDGSNTAHVIGKLFEAMNVKVEKRKTSDLPSWANQFPYVNGGLFSGSTDVPRFTRTARSYLIRAGELNWKQINPDIFGSMIQAVADDEERGALGMHYTSVPNILKVLNPLFLDDLRTELDAAGESPIKLLNLRRRISRIRVFDPACGSGNFLVIAYKEMRKIEAEINQRRNEADKATEIPLTNFRGIEIRDFAAEIARLALIIAEYQCDVLHRGEKLALAEFLPLNAENWIVCGNALRLDWLTVCPPTGTGVKLAGDDLFATPLKQAEIDFSNEGGETYICGNPPYKGSQGQTDSQKEDLKSVFAGVTDNWKSVDYVAGWFMKASRYSRYIPNTSTAFVATNSICQGRQVEALWEPILSMGEQIIFAYTSFRWANLAAHNAGVTVVIIGISFKQPPQRYIYATAADHKVLIREAVNINPYLISAPNLIVKQSGAPLSSLPGMVFGNMPNDGGHLLLELNEARAAIFEHNVNPTWVRPFFGSSEYIIGREKRCIWLKEPDFEIIPEDSWLGKRIDAARRTRLSSDRPATRALARTPWRFGEVRQLGSEVPLIIPSVSSERREYLPAGLLSMGAIISNLAFAIFDAPLWNLALIASRIHLVWIATVCGKLETRYRYSNTLGWNTFPVPTLTESEKAKLTRCAEDILLAREAHFPATIADLYEPDKMPENLRRAHDQNDDTLERIYIGRRFKNDTERLEELFKMYTKMTAKDEVATPNKARFKKATESAIALLEDSEASE